MNRAGTGGGWADAIQAMKNAPPTPTKSPMYRSSSGQPNSYSDKRLTFSARDNRRIQARFTDKEHDRAPDGVAVSRYDAPTEEMCALYEFARWRDLDCLTMNGERLDFYHLAPRPYQPDHERSDGLIEAQSNLRRRARHYRPICRFGAHERGVPVRWPRSLENNCERYKKDSERAEGDHRDR